MGSGFAAKAVSPGWGGLGKPLGVTLSAPLFAANFFSTMAPLVRVFETRLAGGAWRTGFFVFFLAPIKNRVKTHDSLITSQVKIIYWRLIAIARDRQQIPQVQDRADNGSHVGQRGGSEDFADGFPFILTNQTQAKQRPLGAAAGVKFDRQRDD